MNDFLDDCVRNFSSAPRKFSLRDRLFYLRFTKPRWLHEDPTDKLNTLFQHTQSLFEEGVVVWGCVIQANQLLFENGTDDCPGEVVYPITDSRRVDLQYLQQVASDLFSLKGTSPDDPSLAPIADYLTNELIRVFGLAVPSTVSPTLKCGISTTLFVRKHLPKQKLCAPIVPLVVRPHKPNVAMVLPEKFWPNDRFDWPIELVNWR